MIAELATGCRARDARIRERDDQRGERGEERERAARGGASPGGRGATDAASAGGDERRLLRRAIARRRRGVPDGEQPGPRRAPISASGAPKLMGRRWRDCPASRAGRSAARSGRSRTAPTRRGAAMSITALAACAPLDRLAVDRRDHVTELDPAVLCGGAGRDELDDRAGLPDRVAELDAEVCVVRAGRCRRPEDDASIPMTVPAPAAAAISAMNAEPDAQVAGAPKLRGRARARSRRRAQRRRAAVAPSDRDGTGSAKRLAWRRRLGHGVGLRADQAATLRHPRARGRGLRAPVTGPKAFRSHLS